MQSGVEFLDCMEDSSKTADWEDWDTGEHLWWDLMGLHLHFPGKGSGVGTRPLDSYNSGHSA